MLIHKHNFSNKLEAEARTFLQLRKTKNGYFHESGTNVSHRERILKKNIVLTVESAVKRPRCY